MFALLGFCTSEPFHVRDPKWSEWIKTELKVDPDAALDESVRADNACFLAARKDGGTLAIHLCPGNNRSHWYADGGYDAIAEKS
jgi:hypothetical protein